jgi:dipeptidyl aminopeptidase/acylaminoacyl peptidase
LIRKGAAPQDFDPLVMRADANEIEYTSGQLRLKAWVTAPTANAARLPAVLFLHLGFAFGEDDWEQIQPFEDAGYVVMIPMLRGENGLPGNYSMFYDEIEDVLAAAEVFARRPNVDAQRMYIAGHSVGGTMALLTAMTTNRFRAAASFSGSPDQVKWIRSERQAVPFDPTDQRELQMRSPLAFPRSFKCPTRLYYGDQELLLAPSSKKTARLAQAAGLDVEAISVSGDHVSSVDAAIDECIRFFQSK